VKALIITDIQNDFLPGGPLEVKHGDEIIPPVNKLQYSGYFDLIVATQDWHPPDHGSFASNHPGKEPFEETILDGLDQILWPDHCVQTTTGADFSTALDAKKIEAIFRKGMEKNIDTYSGFFDNGHKKDTGMAGYLRGRNIDEIYVTGLAGDICVLYTMRDAINLGFKTTLIKDCTRPIDEQRFLDGLRELKEKNAVIINSSDILSTSA
jgi:nicotinamidase/pyrazinamidase